VTARSTADAEAESHGASAGLLAIGTSQADVIASGSIRAYLDGPVTRSNSVTVTAQAVHTAHASTLALAGGGTAATGAASHATVSPVVAAYPGDITITAVNGVTVPAGATPHAFAGAFGVNVSGVNSVGVSLADAEASPTVTAHVGGAHSTITARTLDVT